MKYKAPSELLFFLHASPDSDGTVNAPFWHQ